MKIIDRIFGFKHLSIKETNELVEKICNRLEPVDLVVGIANGGIIPAKLISEKLNKPLKQVNVGRPYKVFGIPTDQNFIMKNLYFQFFRSKPIIKEFPIKSVKNKTITLVDDDLYSGDTLKLVKNRLIELGAKKVITVTLVSYFNYEQPDISGKVTKFGKVMGFNYNKIRMPNSKRSQHHNEFKKLLINKNEN